MGPEHKCLRNKKVDEEKFVLDLLTIALISGEQYNLLAQVSQPINHKGVETRKGFVLGRMGSLVFEPLPPLSRL